MRWWSSGIEPLINAIYIGAPSSWKPLYIIHISEGPQDLGNLWRGDTGIGEGLSSLLVEWGAGVVKW